MGEMRVFNSLELEEQEQPSHHPSPACLFSSLCCGDAPAFLLLLMGGWMDPSFPYKLVCVKVSAGSQQFVVLLLPMGQTACRDGPPSDCSISFSIRLAQDFGAVRCGGRRFASYVHALSCPSPRRSIAV